MLLGDSVAKREYTIREEKGLGIVISGLTELLVASEEDMQRSLLVGSRSRTTSTLFLLCCCCCRREIYCINANHLVLMIGYICIYIYIYISAIIMNSTRCYIDEHGIE